MIYLWLMAASEYTLQRVQDGGNVAQGLIAQLSAPAFKQSIDKMAEELPLIVYSYQLASNFSQNSSINSTSCVDFYTQTIGLEKSTQATALCNSDLFNFKDINTTSQSLMEVYLNYNTSSNSTAF